MIAYYAHIADEKTEAYQDELTFPYINYHLLKTYNMLV